MEKCNWQPIETAPKDGTEILLCRALSADGKPITGSAWGVFVQVAAWWAEEGDDDGEWVVYCSIPREPLLHFEPSHWRSLPPNPFEASNQGSVVARHNEDEKFEVFAAVLATLVGLWFAIFFGLIAHLIS